MEESCSKELSNPISTGGGGVNFEIRVQASFVVLMLANVYVPYLWNMSIEKIELQGRKSGYHTDDLIVTVRNSKVEHKFLGQIKRKVSITKKDKVFFEVIKAAWCDFNSERFKIGQDSIALITGPLTSTDTINVRELLEWSKTSNDSAEFYTKVKLAKFSNRAKKEKLDVFKSVLIKANDNKNIDKGTLYDFLRHFHLIGYDFDTRTSVCSAFLCGIIGCFYHGDIYDFWERIVGEVSAFNQNGGTVTRENISQDITSKFIKGNQITQNSINMPDKFYWAEKVRGEWVNLVFIGGWNENNLADKKIIEKMSGQQYDRWILSVREILSWKQSPLYLMNKKWRLMHRDEFLIFVSSQIIYKDVENFIEIAEDALSEVNPIFSLDLDKRYMADIYGKKLKYSDELRSGLADGLALLVKNCNNIKNITVTNIKLEVKKFFKELFRENTFEYWGSIDPLLPTLAEISPDDFLNVVENALEDKNHPFEQLFEQESSGIFGQNYIVGLLWALEKLAWSEKTFILTCLVLADLASLDPGGKWGNRPINSLIEIFLPWMPHTLASIEKRINAINLIIEKHPNIAWDLLVKILPNATTVSSGTQRPIWYIDVPKDITISKREYIEHTEMYANLLVDMVKFDPERVAEVITQITRLPQKAFGKLMDFLIDYSSQCDDENKKYIIWKELKKNIARNRHFSNAWWSMDSKSLKRVEDVADRYKSLDLAKIYSYLFTGRDVDLYEGSTDYDSERMKLSEKRHEVLSVILDKNGKDGILELIDIADASSQLGISLAALDNVELDNLILPHLLVEKSGNRLLVASNYIYQRKVNKGLDWLNSLSTSTWTLSEKKLLCLSLPFENDTWNYVEKKLSDNLQLYWESINDYYIRKQSDYIYAVDKLFEYNRYSMALRCLYWVECSYDCFDTGRVKKALLEMPQKEQGFLKHLSYHEIVELIKRIQKSDRVSKDDLINIEWIYAQLLRDGECAPETIEWELSENPSFFCQMLKKVYCSTLAGSEEKQVPRNTVDNAWHLLHNWSVTPGCKKNGEFSIEKFNKWFNEVSAECIKTGYEKVAFINIGKVLIYTPKDDNGLWINMGIAKVLDDRNNEDIRQGYYLGIINSRGAHFIDESGKQEMDIASRYNQYAEIVEAKGYMHFAKTLHEIAEHYKMEAAYNLNGE